MGVAQAVGAVELKIGNEAVVDKAAGEAGEEAEGLKGVSSAFRVDAIPGHRLGADGVEPVKFPSHADATLIAVNEGGLGEKIGHAGFETGKGIERGGQGGLNGGLADGLAKQIGGYLLEAFEGNQLLSAEIDEEGVEAGAVLGGGGDAFREIGGDLAAGNGAPFDFDPVFGHDKFLGRQVKDLAGVVTEDRVPTQRTSTTAWAPFQAVNNDAVGMGDF